MAMRHSVMVVSCSCLIASLVTISPVFAGDSEETTIAKDGFYLGTQFVYNIMSGDFDDSTYFRSSDMVIDAPDVASGYGFGFVAGSRTGAGAVEFGYLRTTHDTRSSFVDIGKSTATYNVIDLNLKVDLLTQYRVRPFLEFGFGIPWMTVKNSALTPGGFEDATYVGVCLNLGGGVVYYFHPRWALTGGLLYRFNWFTSGEGRYLDSSLSEGALALTVGIAYTF